MFGVGDDGSRAGSCTSGGIGGGSSLENGGGDQCGSGGGGGYNGNSKAKRLRTSFKHNQLRAMKVFIH
jgi:hypothetical protein